MKESFREERLANVLEHLDTAYNVKNEIVTLGFIFYTLDGEGYVSVQPIPCFSKFSKGYFKYENYIIEYMGVNDSLASLFIPIENLKNESFTEDYNNEFDNISWDIRARLFHICTKDSIHEIALTKNHEILQVKILHSIGIEKPPPPIPSK